MKYTYKSTIASIILLLFITWPVIAQINLQSGLVACYPFSGNAQDATGNGNNGIVVNEPSSVKDRFGNANSAYQFDGIDDYIRIPFDKLKNESYTYSIWANISALPTDGRNYAVWSFGNTNFDGAGDQFIMLGSNYVFTTQNGWYGGGYNVNGGVTLKAVGSLPMVNTWYHLATTRDKDKVNFYVNGQLIGTASTNGDAPRYGGNPTNSVVEARIGNRSPSLGGQNFKGIIDDFSIYNRSLSADEIVALYKNFACSALPPTTSQDVSPCVSGGVTVNCVIPETVELLSQNLYSADIKGGRPPYTITWSFPDNTLVNSNDTVDFIFTKKGVYSVTVKVVDSKGCVVNCTKLVKVKVPINIPPNVFTPNGDNCNETFTINYEGDEQFNMTIYNRWGKRIVTVSDGLKGWDGTGCSNGVYYYLIKVEDKEFKGWVHLLR